MQPMWLFGIAQTQLPKGIQRLNLFQPILCFNVYHSNYWWAALEYEAGEKPIASPTIFVEEKRVDVNRAVVYRGTTPRARSSFSIPVSLSWLANIFLNRGNGIKAQGISHCLHFICFVDRYCGQNYCSLEWSREITKGPGQGLAIGLANSCQNSLPISHDGWILFKSALKKDPHLS